MSSELVTSLTFKSNDPEFLMDRLLKDPTRHVLFDCDGLILDTEPVYSSVALEALKQILPPTTAPTTFPAPLKRRIMGGTKIQVARQMVAFIQDEYGVKVDLQHWIDLTETLEEEAFQCGEFGVMPGVKEAISLFKGFGWPVAVATSSCRRHFSMKSSHPHTAPLFTHDSFPQITCGDDRDHLGRPLQGKPHPSIFNAARNKLIVDTAVAVKGIVLEDSVNGVVAALRSGHDCIWVQVDAEMTFMDIEETIQALQVTHEIPENLFIYRVSSLLEVVTILNKQL